MVMNDTLLRKINRVQAWNTRVPNQKMVNYFKRKQMVLVRLRVDK